ncbi:TetR-like C-terminal domain-containing protein [Nonomuraea recticatena]|uniref:TetR-like C-terminal domain-containing protein n=1 Tax=Nonomuraea recticatena TaxID=46178 RepID=UPI00361EB623
MFAVAALGRPAPTPSCWRPVTDPEAAELLRRRFLEGRRELIRQMWRRGEQRGELRTDVDVKSPRTSCSAPSSSASSLATPPHTREAEAIAKAALTGLLNNRPATLAFTSRDSNLAVRSSSPPQRPRGREGRGSARARAGLGRGRRRRWRGGPGS